MKNIIVLTAILFAFASFTPKPISWTALGDSITYLNDHKDETGNRITKGYMTMVAEKIPGMQYINKGFNGWKAVDIAKHIDSLGLQKSDVYSVFLGTNDWWGGVRIGNINDYINNTGTGTFYGAYKIINDKLKALNSEAKIILITPMQRVDFVYINDSHNNAWGSYKDKEGQQLAQFAEAILAIGKQEQYKVVDLYGNHTLQMKKLVKYKRLKNPQTGDYTNYTYPAFTGIPFNADTDEYPYPAEAGNYTYDGLHPSDKGYRVIAGMLVKSFQ